MRKERERRSKEEEEEETGSALPKEVKGWEQENHQLLYRVLNSFFGHFVMWSQCAHQLVWKNIGQM